VKGKPLLEHILDNLLAAGIGKVAIVTGYRHELIEEYFAHYPMAISWFHQEELNGTATAVRLTKDFVGPDPFLLTFGDIWCDAEDYRGIAATLTDDVSAVLGVRRVDDPWQGAAVYERDGIVTKIVEKPPKGTSTTYWNSAGLYMFRPDLFEELERVEKSPRGEYEISSAIEQMIERGKKLKIYSIQGVWRDVGRPEDLVALESGPG
jgi:dTDP-glucose pyrophosphorylase